MPGRCSFPENVHGWKCVENEWPLWFLLATYSGMCSISWGSNLSGCHSLQNSGIGVAMAVFSPFSA
eukprot:scaffold46186_cov17-Prasinocladus_malaysianus.AAC.2